MVDIHVTVTGRSAMMPRSSRLSAVLAFIWLSACRFVAGNRRPRLLVRLRCRCAAYFPNQSPVLWSRSIPFHSILPFHSIPSSFILPSFHSSIHSMVRSYPSLSIPQTHFHFFRVVPFDRPLVFTPASWESSSPPCPPRPVAQSLRAGTHHNFSLNEVPARSPIPLVVHSADIYATTAAGPATAIPQIIVTMQNDRQCCLTVSLMRLIDSKCPWNSAHHVRS